MDVKRAFLYGQIEEEVYVCQPPGFEDPDYLDKLYMAVKELYGLHQAPRAWYETLANYLLGNAFHKGKINQTLFIKKQKGDILLVQIYVDDIIFGSTKKELLQQKKDGIFISQDKYVDEILRKFTNTDVMSASTLVDLEKPVKDGDAIDVDEHLYRSMIRSLMYLTTSRPNIMFAVCACARFQVTPKTSHLLAVKRIFRYLKGKPTLGLWYSRDSPFKLVAYTDSDYARATQDRKSTTGGFQFLGNRLYKENGRTCYIRQKVSKTTRNVKGGQDTKVHQSGGPLKKVGDEVVHKKLGDKMERAATTASSLEAEYDSVAYLEKSEGSTGFHEIIDFLSASHIHYALTENPTIYVSFIKQFWTTAAASTRANREVELTATINGHTKTLTEASLRRHLKLEDNRGVSTLPNSEIFEQLALIGYDTESNKLTFQKGNFSPQWSVHLLGRDEGSLSLNELTVLCTSLSKKFEGLKSKLKQTKQTYNVALIKLIKRVKKLEQTIKISKARRRAKIVLLEDEDAIEDSFKHGRKISNINADPTISLVQDEGMTWFQEDAQVQEKQSDDTKVLIEEEEPSELVEDQGSGEKREKEVTTADIALNTASATISTASETPMVSTATKRIVYSRRSEEKRKAKEERIHQDVKQKDEREKVINWNDPDVLRSHAVQNRSFSVAEVRKNMCTYLKNQGSYKMKDFKGMIYEEIRPIFEKVWDFNHAFVPKDSDIEKEVMKRSGFDIQQEPKKDEGSLKRKTSEERMDIIKKQKTDKQDQEEEKIIKYMEIIPVKEIAIDVIPLATKPPMIVDLEIISEGKNIWKIVKGKYGDARPEEACERVLWGDIKVMFEPGIDSEVWKNLENYDVTAWMMYSSCGVHLVRFENLHIFLLVEKTYPLTPATITKMLDRKRQADHQNEMCYQLLKLMLKQQQKK
ncbi:putative ribonuclease H-like domain-containing protein [Tanacetum coccineum]|uniref:Ribonuclease H-like domain-containing protein n=1 Tax=Tanacetum coccineum TaxID=301880 RepID=A0ABQ5H5D4_9ASTR